jgi:acyl-CoA dehydrogenase
MIEFALTDEQRDFRDLAHEFSVNEMRPVATQHDRDGTWPGEVLEKAWELGLMNTRVEAEVDSRWPDAKHT